MHIQPGDQVGRFTVMSKQLLRSRALLLEDGRIAKYPTFCFEVIDDVGNHRVLDVAQLVGAA